MGEHSNVEVDAVAKKYSDTNYGREDEWMGHYFTKIASLIISLIKLLKTL